MPPEEFSQKGSKPAPSQKSEVERAVRKRAPTPKTILYKRDLPRPASVGAPAGQLRANNASGPNRIEIRELPGAEVAHFSGRAFLSTTLAKSHKVLHYVSQQFHKEFIAPQSPLLCRLSESCKTALRLEDLLFMDIESTGLGCSPLFLVGAMRWQGTSFEAHQYLARTYAEEAAVLALFSEQLAGKRLLITFNGKSFDVPYLRMRAAANSIAPIDTPAQLDLLHESRKIWKKELPDCKLQTLERRICRRTRTGDIPGHEIAQVYHDFVRTGDAARIKNVLSHNLLDLITLADILVHMPPPHSKG